MRNYGQCIDRHPDASKDFDEFGGQIVTPRTMNVFDEMSEEEIEYWRLLDDEDVELDEDGSPVIEEGVSSDHLV